ncbi:MAG: 3-phosphoserine/phosphohydroxythreonine transaminase [Nannocystaceae bacterium]
MDAQAPVIRNFSAGPAILPQSVIERASEGLKELRQNGHDPSAPGIGLSILEISHRSPPYDAVTKAAEQLCHEVLGIPTTHQVLFLQGGASLQFAMVPMNLRREGKATCYVDTGAWSTKAIAEAEQLGPTKVIATSKATGFDRIPEMPAADVYADTSYVHITTNNTIYGTEFAEIPTIAGGVPLVADMSSDIGSQAFAYDRVDLGFAGAQKNLGPSGVTLVFIRRELLAQAPMGVVPKILRYATHAKNPSLYNTPNTFGVFVLKLMLDWLKGQGGVPAMEARNRRKAKALYDVLDASSLYTPHAQTNSRSLMNVAWTLGGAPEAAREELTSRFLAGASERGLSGLKGHRSVGGLRASIYNAFPEAGVQELCSYMKEFEQGA